MSEPACKVCGQDESAHGHVFAASSLLHNFAPAEPAKPARPDGPCKVCGARMGYGPHAEGVYSHPFDAQEPADAHVASERPGAVVEPSEEARFKAGLFARVASKHESRRTMELARVFQQFIDERDEQRGFKQDALDRAERAEGQLAELRASSIEKLRFEESARAESAEADAKLAWHRVTELQERGTQLVIERRAVEAKLAEFVRATHAYASLLPDGWSLHEIARRYEATL